MRAPDFPGLTTIGTTMERGTLLIGLWALFVLGTFTGATYYGYSPFADGGRGTFSGVYGPTHK